MDYKKFGPNNILTNLLSQIFSSNTHFKLSLCLLFWLKQKIYSLKIYLTKEGLGSLMPLSTIFQLYRGGIDKKNLEKKN